MAWDKGFNFRATSGFVTDGSNETYVLEEMYPTTRNGVTFGWNAGLQTRDRNSSLDRRLAGSHFTNNTGTQRVFRVDLPSAQDYVISLALGDAQYAQAYLYWQLLDNTNSLAIIDDTDGTAGSHFDDATGVDRTAAAWPADNLTITKTFATTTLNCKIGSPSAQAGASTLAHLFVSQAAGGGKPWYAYAQQ